MLDDRSCGAERVRTDPEDDGVPRAHHTARISEDVRTAFEHKPDNAEWGTSRLDSPTIVIDGRDRHIASSSRVAPSA